MCVCVCDRWTTCDDSVLMFLKDHVEPLVKDILPSTVGESMSLGTHAL